MIEIRRYTAEDRRTCVEIFTDLKEWFGPAVSAEGYLVGLEDYSTWIAQVGESIVGFLSVRPSSVETAEIRVMAVRRGLHRQGVGELLVRSAEDWCRARRIPYLQIKVPDPADHEYFARTRAFFESCGFVHLDTLARLWNPTTPAIQLVKRVHPCTAEELVKRLELEPHPEGGYYRETWRSSRELDLPDYSGTRSAGTSILFLLAAGQSSAWHRVASDELWMWQGGDPLRLSIKPERDGEVHTLVLGPTNPQGLVPAGQWQAATPDAGPHGYALSGCVVVPGFDFADFEMA